MRKNALILGKALVAGLIIATIGTGCNKSRTCDCKVTYKDVGGNTETKNYSYTVKTTKKNGEAACREFVNALTQPPEDMDNTNPLLSDASAECTLK